VPKARKLISIIDDDHAMREAIDGLVKSVGYVAASVASAEEFLGSRHVRRTSCLIADIRMPGMSGLELHQRLSASGKPIPTILITAYPDEGARKRALAAGVVGYLSKPFEEVDLLACIRSALAHASGDGSEGR
jgi:FixJ family two-component response regulator